ncbi:MAG: DUF1127 domain-containing protein [Pseudomonadota bacterium]
MAYALSSSDTVRLGSDRGWIAEVKRRIADYRRYRTTLAELESLSDRELNDINLSRFSVKAVAWESIYGK